MWARTKTWNSYIRGKLQILLTQTEISYFFHYDVDIISNLMTVLTELVELNISLA